MKKLWIVGLIVVCLIPLCGCSKIADELAIPKRYVEAVKLVKNDLKDPTSMRIYGDILVLTMLGENDTTSIISVIYDAKNSYGAYEGKTTAEICLTVNSDPMYITDDSSSFIDIRFLIDNLESKGVYLDDHMHEWTESGSHLVKETFSGKAMASLLNVEYYDA